MIALPAFAHSLPNTTHAPDPQVVAALLGPLEVLCPLLEESSDHGIALIRLQPEPNIAGTEQESLVFLDIRPKAKSAHERLHNPWLRPGPQGKLGMLAQAGLDFSHTLTPLFGPALTAHNVLELYGETRTNTSKGFRISIAELCLCVPRGPQAPLLLATIFAVLHSIIRNGRPTAEIWGWNPPQGHVRTGTTQVHGGPSFTLPGSDDADRRRFHAEARALSAHLDAAFATAPSSA